MNHEFTGDVEGSPRHQNHNSGGFDMPDTGSMLGRCDEEIPILGVTRQFNFGQFIELFDPGTGPNPVPVPIVVDPIGNLKLAEAVRSSSSAATGTASTSSAATATNDITALGGRSIQSLLRTPEDGIDPVSDVEIDDLRQVDEALFVAGSDEKWQVRPTSQERNALGAGYLVPLDAQASPGKTRVLRVRLKPQDVQLDADEVATLLATRKLKLGATEWTVRLDHSATQALLSGRKGLLPAVDANDAVHRLIAFGPRPGKPAPGVRTVTDLATFLVAPTARDRDGRDTPISLTAVQVAELRNKGESLLEVEGGTLRIALVASQSSGAMAGGGKVSDNLPVDGDEENGADPGGAAGGRVTVVGGSGGGTAAVPATTGGGAPLVVYVPPFLINGGTYTPPPAVLPGNTLTGHVESRLPSGRGIPVAVMVPWLQTWTLTGFSRGALLSSLALTPQEEVVIETHSWERRVRGLDQSSETDTEQSFQSSATTKDSDETFDELTSKQDFTWQVGGSLDVSYSPGVASIQLSANASAESMKSLARVARTTAAHTRESTTKAAATVRARRVTRITETVETGSDNRVTRRIRNPNLTRTVTYDFFETLAHYEVALAFKPEHLSVVALIRNPESRQPADFTATLVRQNETTFRNALLESSLVDGFAALRLLAAQAAARSILGQREADAKKAAGLREERLPAATQTGGAAAEPAASQLKDVLDALRPIHAAARKLRDEANVDIALQRIREQSENQLRPMSEDERRCGQYWLFVQCLAARFPSLLDGLQALASVNAATLGIVDAQKLVTVMPPTGSPRSLASLSELTAREKEECGLQNAINRWKRIFWDWDWWTTRCREELLYTPNDAGIVGHAEKLSKALEAWEAKRAEGEFAKDKDVALKDAESKQDGAMTDDQLSMAFPLDEHARAVERADALLGHIAAHPHHYSYALFQALTPSEQVSRILAASGGQLQVGLFEPRVVAMHGERLAVPLTALAVGGLEGFTATMRTTLSAALAADVTGQNPPTVVLPTPGVNVNSRLGKCSAAEPFVEDSRSAEVELARARLRLAQAEADSAAAEAKRRRRLLATDDLSPFAPAVPATP